MPQRKIGRREFLKLAIASTAAAGLSHFRVLNIGGADIALAQWDQCENDDVGGSTDTCEPPGDPDTCPEGFQILSGYDLCDGTTESKDACIPDIPEPDDCTVSADACEPPQSDVCEVGSGSPDTCNPGSDPDICNPFIAEPDECPDAPDGDGDVCCPQGTYEPDICDTNPPIEDEDVCTEDSGPDICIPIAGNPDHSNPVTISSAGVKAASSALPSLGGVAAALGAAALWLRHRLRPEKPEEPKTE